MASRRHATIVRTCEKCGKEYHPWNAKPSRWCSRACAPKGRQPSMPDATCPTCGVAFRPADSSRTYCSRKCYREAPDRRTVTSGGYVLVYRPEHPAAYASGQVLEHRVVAEQHLGRLLEAHETVHHMNGVRDDNRWENLQVRSGRHGRGTRHRCLDCGSTNVEAVEL